MKPTGRLYKELPSDMQAELRLARIGFLFWLTISFVNSLFVLVFAGAWTSGITWVLCVTAIRLIYLRQVDAVLDKHARRCERRKSDEYTRG